MRLLPPHGVGPPQVLPGPPQLAPDGPVEEEQAEHGAEEVGGGDPDGGAEQARGHGVGRGLALERGVLGLRGVLVLHPHQHQHGPGGEEGEGPERHDHRLHPPLGHHHLGLEREADGQVALHAERRDVQDGGVGAALVDVVRQPAHQLPEHPGRVLPQAVQVKGQAEEDEQVRHGHAGQVEVGGGLHVLEALDDEDGHGVAQHAHEEEEQADDGDGDEGGGGEEGAPVVMMVLGVRVLHGSSKQKPRAGPRLAAGGGRRSPRKPAGRWTAAGVPQTPPSARGNGGVLRGSSGNGVIATSSPLGKIISEDDGHIWSPRSVLKQLCAVLSGSSSLILSFSLLLRSPSLPPLSLSLSPLLSLALTLGSLRLRPVPVRADGKAEVNRVWGVHSPWRGSLWRGGVSKQLPWGRLFERRSQEHASVCQRCSQFTRYSHS